MPPATEDGLKCVSERLREYGDLRAWHLATDIDVALRKAD